MSDTDQSRVTWRKSSYSGGNGNCVEIADLSDGLVAVRDSKDPHGPVLKFGRAAWADCLGAVKRGELDGLA
ncbi:DUF397 domain-containing protein [Sphaerisporangium sp. NPDC088356]|uniref:DUF397 domain-containing protein n=1 Tax=Sphaerisporangium sp. NPDC088356 TaxID=3154871 RepID=UPI00343E9F80